MVATGITINNQIVWLDTNSATPVGLNLINSNLGPTSLLASTSDNNPNQMDLSNANLRGVILSESGNLEIQVNQGGTATNSGLIAAGTPSGHTTIGMQAYGPFTNTGDIFAGENGSFGLIQGAGTTPNQVFINSGTFAAEQGGAAGVSSYQTDGVYGATVVNQKLMAADGGTLDITDNVSQMGRGVVSVTNGGTFDLTGTLDGGTVSLNNATVNLNLSTGPGFIGSDTTLAFLGSHDTINFDEPVRDAFDASTSTLTVFQDIGDVNQKIGTYHVTGGSYTTADFTTYGTVLTFTSPSALVPS